MHTTLRSIILSCTIIIAATASAQKSGIDNPMTKAVLDVYSQQLKENPKDYETWFLRASEYYRHDQYARALDDINNALKYTPGNNTDMRIQELMLRANIYIQTGKKEPALADLSEVLQSDPASYMAIYQRANIEYESEQYSKAKSDYQKLQRINPRSTEAMIGLARVAVKENNLGMANDYLEQAVALDPNNADIYMRRASVRRLMGNGNGAVDDMIIALSTDPSNSKAIEAIVEYGNTDYTAVMTGLSNAIAQAPKVGMFLYLRAMIAQAHFKYLAAISDYEKILDEQLYNYNGLYASIGECQYYLGDFSNALDNVDHALSSITDNAGYFVLRAKIQRALGLYDDAISSAANALAIDKNNTQAITEMGLCYINKGDYGQASALFGEATMTDAENPYYYMLRAWTSGTYLDQPSAAEQFYDQVAEMDMFFLDNVRSLKGFALLYQDKVTQAVSWMDNILNLVADNDGLANYYGACFYAQKGDNDRAIRCAEQSLKNGYANYYDWMFNNDARINVAPLRDDLRFLNLLQRYSVIFQK